MESHLVDNLAVYFDDGNHCGKSRVYAIDCVKDRLLVVFLNDTYYLDGKFLWVDISDCKPINMEEL